MYMYIFIMGYIRILLGGDWNMIFMCPVGNRQIIPIDELIFFRRGPNRQAEYIIIGELCCNHNCTMQCK